MQLELHDGTMVIDFYNQLADVYDTYYQRNIDRAENRALTWNLQHWGFDQETVLDLGCGTGLAGELCAFKSYRGVDGSAQMLRVAAKKHPQATFDQIVLGVDELDFKDASAVVSFYALQYVPELEPIAEAIQAHTHKCLLLFYSPYYKRRKNYIGNQQQTNLTWYPRTTATLHKLFPGSVIYGFNIFGERLNFLPVTLLTRYLLWEQFNLRPTRAWTYLLYWDAEHQKYADQLYG